MLKPEDIENKVFDKAMSGYKREDVDAFLLEVNETLVALYKELDEIKQKYQEREESVYTTLETAKGLIADISVSAEKRADIILRNAQLDADALTKQTAANVASLKQQEEALKVRLNALKLRIKKELETELLNIDSINGD